MEEIRQEDLIKRIDRIEGELERRARVQLWEAVVTGNKEKIEDAERGLRKFSKSRDYDD